MNKKLIFFTSRLPLIPMSGREISLYYYIKHLHEEYKYEIIVITFDNKYTVVNKPNEYIARMYTCEKPGKKDILSNFTSMILLKKLPLQVFLYYSKKIQNEINSIIKNEKPDILICDMVRTCEYFKNADIKKVFDMDDMLSIRYRRQLQSDGKIINPFGAYFENIPKITRAFFNNNFIKKLILEYESRTLIEYEICMAKLYDAVVLVSEKEKDFLNNKLENKNVFSVTTGVNCEYFYENTVEVEKETISFLGVYSAPHNEDAVLYFYNEIYPYIKEKIVNISLRLIGNNVTPKIQQLSSDKSVNVIGRVEDVREFIKPSRVFIAPLRFGSGIKTKILEAMAMGVPVVTTTIGAEGMGLESYKNIIIEDEPEAFAEAVCKLINDDDLYNRISSNARNYVLNNYDWNVIMKDWNYVFEFIDKKDEITCRQ